MPQDTNHIMQSFTDVLTVSEDAPEHEYRGIAPITVDNLYDTISIDNAAITKLQSTETVQVSERTDVQGHTVYHLQASDNGTPFQTKLGAGENIDINQNTNIISVTNKRRLVVDAPLTKTIDQNTIHIGINGQGYTYSAGKNMKLTNNVFDCNGSTFDYGLNNTLSGISNYIVGNSNYVENNEDSLRANFVYGSDNNVSGNGWNFVYGYGNNTNTTVERGKTFVVGRYNTVTSELNNSYGTFVFGDGLSANDNHAKFGFPLSNIDVDIHNITYNAAKHIINGDFAGTGKSFDYGNNNNLNNRDNTIVIGYGNTTNDDTSSTSTRQTSFVVGVNNNTTGVGNNVIIGQGNNTNAPTVNSRTFVFGRGCSAYDNGTSETRYGSLAIGAYINAETNEMNLGFPTYGLSIKNGDLYTRRSGTEHKIGKVSYNKTGTFDSTSNSCTITFDTTEYIEYGTLRLNIYQTTQATLIQIRIYNSDSSSIQSTLVHLEAGTYHNIVLPFVGGTPKSVEIINDSSITPSAPGSITGDIYAEITGISL